MVKDQKKTRKTRKQISRTKKQILTIPQLRKAFQHMDKVVEDLRSKSKHSFSDVVLIYREEWNKTFKRDLSPADAASYLKFRYGLKSGKTRRSHMRGGAIPLAGAPLDYQTRAGVDGVYGNFPTYQTQGLDRYYGNSMNSDCGKENLFPTDGSATSQAGGGSFDALFRPIMPTAPATTYPFYPAMMTDPGKGTPPYPSSDPVGQAPYRAQPPTFINPDRIDTHLRLAGYDMYKTAAGPRI
jgi:hypothetical protein